MSTFDPYEILGLAPGATQQAVKAAYRQKVQLAHPDRGGDPEDFILVVRAFDLLSDPDARRLFDEAGIVDDDGVRNYRKEVAIILADMFDTAVETAIATGLGLDNVNFISQMSVAVESGLLDAKKRLSRTERDILALQGLRNRIRRNDDDRNLFAERLDAQITSKTGQHLQIKHRVAILETALLELGNYQSEIELLAALEADA
jgi:curved DNA-binding protein CbpA